jgi:hypothetical protein
VHQDHRVGDGGKSDASRVVLGPAEPPSITVSNEVASEDRPREFGADDLDLDRIRLFCAPKIRERQV